MLTDITEEDKEAGQVLQGLLTFGLGSAKVGEHVHTFSLPAGYTCPGASACLARANRDTGHITDGPDQSYRCYAATMEARHSNIRQSRWKNLERLRAAAKTSCPAASMADLIIRSLKALKQAPVVVRVHVGGDFFSADYFRAWCLAAEAFPSTLFYAYTKSIHHWHAHLDDVPTNLALTASRDGKFDHLIDELPEGRNEVHVVFSEEEAELRGLEIDKDDTHAQHEGGPFALLLHGTQPKGTEAATALSEIRKRKTEEVVA